MGNLKALLQSVLIRQYLYTAASSRSKKHCLQINSTFRLMKLVTDKKGTSKSHFYKQEEGILFSFLLTPSKKGFRAHQKMAILLITTLTSVLYQQPSAPPAAPAERHLGRSSWPASVKIMRPAPRSRAAKLWGG